MARTIRDSSLETRTARSRLPIQHDYYRRSLDHGLQLLYRRGERGGAWSAQLYLGGGKRRTAKLGTADDTADADGIAFLNFSQAQAAARKLFEGIKRADAGLPEVPAGPCTVADAMADYLAWLEGEGRSAQAIGDTRSKTKGHILPKLAHLRLDQLTTKTIRDWHHAMAKAPPRLRVKAGGQARHRDVDLTDADVRRGRRATANRVFSILRAALNKAWRDHKVENDKAWRSVKPFKGVTASRARYLSLDECRRLINAADEDFRVMIRAGLYTGCRWSELYRLKASDFNPDAGTVAVRISKSSKPRHVVLNDDGVRFFEAMVVRAGNREHLFARADGEPWKTSWQIRPMKAACASAQIKPPVGFHTLRHTWASHAVMNDVPLLVVAKNLGHRDTRMVELHYGHLAPSFESDVIRRSGLRFEPASQGDGVVLLRQRDL